LAGEKKGGCRAGPPLAAQETPWEMGQFVLRYDALSAAVGAMAWPHKCPIPEKDLIGHDCGMPLRVTTGCSGRHMASNLSTTAQPARCRSCRCVLGDDHPDETQPGFCCLEAFSVVHAKAAIHRKRLGGICTASFQALGGSVRYNRVDPSTGCLRAPAHCLDCICPNP
jgi:hypothetical protein